MDLQDSFRALAEYNAVTAYCYQEMEFNLQYLFIALEIDTDRIDALYSLSSSERSALQAALSLSV